MKWGINPHSAYDYADIVQDELYGELYKHDSVFKNAGDDNEVFIRPFVQASPIPVNQFVSKSVCILGATGCGKTSAVAVFIEEFCRADLSFTVFDIEGDYVTVAEMPEFGVREFEVTRSMSPREIATMAMNNIKGRERWIYTFNSDVSFEAVEFFIWRYSKQVRFGLEKLKKRRHIYAPHILILDEAHMFLKPNRESQFSDPLIREYIQISKRGRKYGCSLLIASQRAVDIIMSILANMQGRYLMQVTEPADKKRYRETLSSKMNERALYDIMYAVPSLRSGEAIYISENNEAYPVRFRRRESLHLSTTPRIEDYADKTALSQINVEEYIDVR